MLVFVMLTSCSVYFSLARVSHETALTRLKFNKLSTIWLAIGEANKYATRQTKNFCTLLEWFVVRRGIVKSTTVDEVSHCLLIGQGVSKVTHCLSLRTYRILTF